MKLIRTALRFWITLSAGSSFVIGWFLLAHAPKPVQSSSAPVGQVAPMPTLAALPPLDLSGTSSSGGAGMLQAPGPQQSQGFLSSPPLFTTGGS
jgi:hypothetical protein